MNKRKFLFLPIILTAVLSSSSCTEKQTDANDRLYYTTPAEIWEETLPLGNGRLGMMPGGGIYTDHIILNEISLWSGTESDYSNPQAAECLPEIRNLLMLGQNDKAQEVMYKSFVPKKDVADPRYGSYEVLGLLTFVQNYASESGKDSISAYSRSLDLSQGVAYTDYKVNGIPYHREYLVSRDRDCIILYLHSEKENALNFSASLSRDHSAGISIENDGLVMQGELCSGQSDCSGMKYKTILKVITGNGKTHLSKEDGVTVTDATEAMIVISATTSFEADGTDFPGKVYAERCDSLLKTTCATPYREIKSSHIAAHRNLYDRIRIQLPEDADENLPTDQRLQKFQKTHSAALAELYYNYGRYLLISSTRRGSLPPNLQGLWAKTIQTPWNGDYHTNINVQMNHWPSYSAGLGELNEPLIQLVKRLVASGEKTAKTFYGSDARGWVMHMMTNIWNYTAPGEHPSWGATNTGGAWLCAHLWEHFIYTKDTAYLREIYPILKGASEFFHSTMISEPEHGWLVTAPTSSPENSFFIEGCPAPVSICMGPTMDVQIITELYRNVIAAAETLNTDQDYCMTLKQDLGHFPPMQISHNGYLQEWLKDYREAEIRHRHVSHLYGLYPGHLITPSATPALADAARATLDRRGDEGTGWSRAWKINFWARLYDGERAWRLFCNLLQPAIDSTATQHHSGTYPNLFCAHPPFQIDGNFGGAAGISEMLVQSHEGFIHLLPAVPACWDKGSVKGFIVRPGAVVDFTWENLQVKTASITALHDDRFIIRCPEYCSDIHADHAGTHISSDNSGMLILNLKKGQKADIGFTMKK